MNRKKLLLFSSTSHWCVSSITDDLNLLCAIRQGTTGQPRSAALSQCCLILPFSFIIPYSPQVLASLSLKPSFSKCLEWSNQGRAMLLSLHIMAKKKKNQWINLFLFCGSFMVVDWSFWYFLACEISATPTDSKIYFLVVVYQDAFRNQAWVRLIIQFIYNLPDDSSQQSKQKRRHPVSGLCHNTLDLCNTWS